MRARLRAVLRGDRLGQRALRSSSFTALGYAASQALRLGSNLILTRLLVPEAFGAMALVNAFVIGLMMFSDMGTGPAIQKSARGDDPAFLDTAWSIQAMRGAGLWLVALVLAWPIARFYNEPLFAHLFPVAALSLIIGGLMPTRVDSAMRHLLVGRLTWLELASQAAGIGVTVLLAAAMRSVWALVLGGVIGTAIQVALMQLALPGAANRFRLEPEARAELLGFGRWILLSTICGFLLFQGDRLVLGRYLTLDEMGIYNIAYFLGTVPMMLGNAVAGRLFIPLYRESPPAESEANRRHAGRVRLRLSTALLGLVALLGVGGPALVGLLYDARYAGAAPLVVLIALIQIPGIVALGYESVPLAAGDSRGLFVLQAFRAGIYMTCLMVGAHRAGLPGVLAGQAVAGLMLYPASAALARRYGAWRPGVDLALATIGACISAAALYLGGYPHHI